jgi:uncharacterized protein
VNAPGLALLAWLTAAIGALGGLGGAILLVPLLVLTGTSASVAAPLGLASAAAGSVAAGALQLRERTVNHRIGVTTEVAASVGAVAGAIASNAVGDRLLTIALAVSAIAASVLGGRRSGIRNRPDPALGLGDIGEYPGELAGAYFLGDAVVPYRARRLLPGLGIISVSGVVAGLSGVSGGFLKTPALTEVMRVPVKVAASTVTFTVGVTAASGLIVYAAQDRIDSRLAAAAIAGSIIGGAVGARIQARLNPPMVRRVLSLVLLVVGVVLLARG